MYDLYCSAMACHVDSCHVAVAEYTYAGHSTVYSVVSRIPRLYVTEPLGGACKVEIFSQSVY